MTAESIYQSFVTLLKAGIQSGTVCWKAVMGEIIRVTLCGEMFFFLFHWLFLVTFLLCKYFDVFLLLLLLFPLLFWLINHLVNQCSPRPRPPTPFNHITPPHLHKWVTLMLLSLGGDGAKLTFPSVFCTWQKKEAIVPSLSVHIINIPMLYWMYYGWLNKGKTFRFLTIQIEIMKCAWKNSWGEKKEKNLKNIMAEFFRDLYCHDYSIEGWTVLKVCFVVFWNGSFSYYACRTDLIRQPSK